MRYRKTTPICFCYQTPLNLSISYTFQVNSLREVFLEKKLFVKISVHFSTCFLFFFFLIKIRQRYLTRWTQWSNTCYFEKQITSVSSESLSGFLKKVKLADIGLQYEFFWKYLIVYCFLECERMYFYTLLFKWAPEEIFEFDH